VLDVPPAPPLAPTAPFVLATVTRRRGPSSGKARLEGADHADGTAEGWLGGARGAHIDAARAGGALADAAPRLVLGSRTAAGA
jgi:hypothetical protein